MSETPPQPQRNWFSRHKVLSVILGLIVLGTIASAGGKNSQPASSPAASDKTAAPASPAQSTTPTATAKPAATATAQQVLPDLPGTGTKTTQKFTAAGDWDLSWSYDCSNFGQQGNFQVMVYDDKGALSVDNGLVNQLGAKGADVEHYHHGGTFYLVVNSECTWHITAKG